MIVVDISKDDQASICSVGWEAMDTLPPSRKIARLHWAGRVYRVVRVYGGMQIQSADKRRLIVERATRA